MSANTDYNNNSEYSSVTLSLDDGTEVECAVIRTYRYSINSDNEPVLENIESDEEYEIVSDAFDEELDAMEYEELYAQEDS